jgi:ubiquinone/menaquinone biosynthesis C-methylase UbiE
VTDEKLQGGACDRFFARPTGNERERLRATFDQGAGLYDRARPRYPVALYDDLIEMTGITPAERLLEIGCATGIATRPLLNRGIAVVCLEPG